MYLTTQLTNRLNEVLLDGKWIAFTNYKLLLSDITWKEAITKIGTLNTIAALTYHINYYNKGIADYLETGTLNISDKYSFDHPTISCSDDWQSLVNDFLTTAERLSGNIKKLDKDKLLTTFVDEKYGNHHRNMEGMIEHGYYHMGQVVIIKKLIREGYEPK